jgi:putative salt-induced outer membrane protein YdiY
MNVRQLAGPALALGRASGLCLTAVLVLASASARAQPTDAPHHAEKVAAEPFQKDVTTFSASLGGSLNTGNTQAMLLNAGTVFAIVRGRHGLGLSMDFAYGRANLPSDTVDALVDTARNLRSRGRYDLFLTEMDALFLAGVYRWDTFAGLDARLSGQVGYLRNLLKQDEVRLWGELGYDLTYDNFDPDPLRDPNNASVRLKGYQYTHSARLFLGYDYKLNTAVALLAGAEGLLNVERPKDFRFNFDVAVRSSIIGRLQLELKLSMQLDTEPVPGKEKLDAQTKANLIYTLI